MIRTISQACIGIRRPFVAAMLIVVVMLAASGCGDGGSAGPYAGGKSTAVSAKEQKEQYARSLTAALDAMEDAEAPPAQESVNRGDQRALQNQSVRWAQAGQIIEELSPPAEAKAAHDRLVSAMRALSTWNQRMVKAAPNRSRTRSVYRQALKSPAARDYGAALQELEKLGYLPAAQQDPMAGAGSPVE